MVLRGVILCTTTLIILVTVRAAPSWSKLHKTSPEENNNFFEGDIIIPGEHKVDLRNVVTRPESLWPNKTLVYELSDEFAYVEKTWIRLALLTLQKSTCVRLIERTDERNYMFVRNAVGCASPVGYNPVGRVAMYLRLPACIKWGTIQHEFLHALGFWHEHTRPDRDQYVKVLWQNIQKGREGNFAVRNIEEAQYEGMPYDFSSVMHYPETAFSRDDKLPTLVPRQHGIKMGQRKKFSKIDIAKLNRLYDCGSEYYLGNDILGTTVSNMSPTDGTTSQSNPSTTSQSNPSTTSQSNPSTTSQSNPSTTENPSPGTTLEPNSDRTRDSSLDGTSMNSNPSTTPNSDPSTTPNSDPSTTPNPNPSTTLVSSPSPTPTENIKTSSVNLPNVSSQENNFPKQREMRDNIKKLSRKSRQSSYYPYRDPNIGMRPPPPTPHYWHTSPDDRCPCQTQPPVYHGCARHGPHKHPQGHQQRRPRQQSINKSINSTNSAEMYDYGEEDNSDTANATQYAAAVINRNNK